jgi:hypothetical protein
MRQRAAESGARVSGCLNDPREKGSSSQKTEVRPGRLSSPFTLPGRLDGAQMATWSAKVKRILRGRVMFESLPAGGLSR